MASSTNYGHVKFQSTNYTVIGQCCYSEDQFEEIYLTDTQNPTCICLRWSCNNGGKTLMLCTCCQGVRWEVANIYTSTPLLNQINQEVLNYMAFSEGVSATYLRNRPLPVMSISFPCCKSYSKDYGYILCALLVPNTYHPRVLGN